MTAVRIKARAIRRCGELAKGWGPPAKNRVGTGPIPGRAKAARDAGLSPRQLKDALRVASIPDPRPTR
jgi:hypothetical protein